eukprot:Phypoly_transcript_10247.p1 GENE.Phypoly_transcript_10247~~Phypoly_transcript_10247.p1  ORF type:complete len:378 (+),score=67.83 Phypoly_transcript_10247:179-1312(+)
MVNTTPCPGEPDQLLANVNGRIFRKVKIDHGSKKPGSSTSSLPKFSANVYGDEQECAENNYKIEKDPQFETYRIRFNLHNAFYKFIIGKAGATKNKIQQETGATITIPKQDSKSDEIIIKGPSEASVSSAKTRLDVIVASALPSVPFTHFLSIPLRDEDGKLHAKLGQLRDDILAKFGGNKDMHPSIFQDPQQFHLTILMLKLYSLEDVQKAQKILQDAGPKLYDIVGTRSVIIHMKGLEYMNDDPHEVDVLYVKVTDEGKCLQELCKYLVDLFCMAGLAPPQDRDVKLHATFINTKLRESEDGKKDERGKRDERDGRRDGRREEKERMAIDAAPIFAAFGDVDLGTCKATGIHLSQRGEFEEKTGYWKSVATVKLP